MLNLVHFLPKDDQFYTNQYFFIYSNNLFSFSNNVFSSLNYDQGNSNSDCRPEMSNPPYYCYNFIAEILNNHRNSNFHFPLG